MADVSGYTYGVPPQTIESQREHGDRGMNGFFSNVNRVSVSAVREADTCHETPYSFHQVEGGELPNAELLCHLIAPADLSRQALSEGGRQDVSPTGDHDPKTAEADTTFKSPSAKSGELDCSETTPRAAGPAAPASPVAKKRTSSKRTVFTQSQLTALEGRFVQQSFLSRDERQELAETLEISERQVMVWFQNRRGRLKKRGPADMAYNPMKLNELNNRRPYPFLYGMLSSMHYQNNPYPQVWSAYPETVKETAASAFDPRPPSGGKVNYAVAANHANHNRVHDVDNATDTHSGDNVVSPGNAPSMRSERPDSVPRLEHGAALESSRCDHGSSSPGSGMSQAVAETSSSYADSQYTNNTGQFPNVAYYPSPCYSSANRGQASYNCGYPSGYDTDAYNSTQSCTFPPYGHTGYAYGQPEQAPTNIPRQQAVTYNHGYNFLSS